MQKRFTSVRHAGIPVPLRNSIKERVFARYEGGRCCLATGGSLSSSSRVEALCPEFTLVIFIGCDTHWNGLSATDT